MRKKAFFFFAILLYLGVCRMVSAEKGVSESANFNEKWRKAANLIVFSPNPGEGILIFQELLQANPNEWLLYDVYGQALLRRGDFNRAIRVYKRALFRRETATKRREEILARIKDIKNQQQFVQAIEKAPSWNEAEVFGTGSFLVKTNIPREYIADFLQRITALHEDEIQMLKKIFGPSERVLPGMNIFIYGRKSEYEAFVRSSFGIGEVYFSAYYLAEKKSLVIFYNGDTDWGVIAELMVTYLVEQLYTPHPSLWLNNGLQQYIAYKLEKETGKNQMLQQLEFLNWMYNQGEWQGVMDLFTFWEKYLNTGALDKALQAKRKFDNISWVLVHFFLEGGSSFYSNYFKEYLKYEMESGIKTYASVQNYFEEHLSKEQMRKLDDESIRYGLGLTYEKI